MTSESVASMTFETFRTPVLKNLMFYLCINLHCDNLSTDSQQLEMHLNKVKQSQREVREPVLAEFKSCVDNFKSSTQAMQTSIANSVQAHLSAELQKTNQK